MTALIGILPGEFSKIERWFHYFLVPNIFFILLSELFHRIYHILEVCSTTRLCLESRCPLLRAFKEDCCTKSCSPS